MNNFISATLNARVDYRLGALKWFLFLCAFSALSIVLPYICHQFGIAGLVFLPMHFAVLLAGMVMGIRGGLIVGAVCPIISYATSGMPEAISLFPITVELITYGVMAGFMLHILKKSVLFSLLVALLAGRVVSIVLVSLILGRVGLIHQLYSLFILAIPGLIIQITLIPPLIVKISHFLRNQES